MGCGTGTEAGLLAIAKPTAFVAPGIHVRINTFLPPYEEVGNMKTPRKVKVAAYLFNVFSKNHKIGLSLCS